MYQQGYNQSYGQYGSYGQYESQYSGFDSRPGGTSHVSPPPLPPGPAGPRIVLDEYNSDLNFVIEPDGVTGSSLHKDGFEYMWGGARATHGVRSGKVSFEVSILEKLPVTMPETETNPHVVRVGWSVDTANLQVGEDNLSYGYGGTGKVSVNNKFFDYGEPYTSGDTICCCIDLDATPRVILFTKNGNYLGVAFRLGAESNGQTFFPHVTVKNMRLAINFGQYKPSFPPLQGFSFLSCLPPQNVERGSVGPSSREGCEIIMMVGLPGSGKTVWGEKYAKEHPEKKYHILGTNTVMDKMKVMGLLRKRNYHGRWDTLIKQATDVLNKLLKIAERRNRNYILDQTNVYFSARRRKMNNFRGFHRIAAVIVNTNEVLKERTEKREKEEGKIVPESAVLEMKANFVLPEVGEIFDDVWFIEENKASSERLVAEFQCEGKEFKEREKKRKADEDSASNENSDVKRPRSDQTGPTVPSEHNRHAQHPKHSDCGGFHGNSPRDQRGVSHDKPYHGPLPGTHGAQVRPRNDYRAPLPPSGRAGQPHGDHHAGHQDRYNDYNYRSSYRPQENYDCSTTPSYQTPSSENNYQYNPSTGGDSRYQSDYQPIGNRYGQPPPTLSQYGQQYGQYYSDQSTAQSYQRGQSYYSGGVGRGQFPPGGQYDPYRYGGGY